MRIKRTILIATAGLTAVAASLLLMAALAPAQSAAQPEAPAQAPVTFPHGNWPWYAQEEISVAPEPPAAGHPTHLCADVVNHTAISQPVVIEFSVANFGIGVPFHPVGHTAVTVLPYGMAHGCIVWVPPQPGHWCIQARLMIEQHPDQISQRNIDIWEPLVPGETHPQQIPVGPLPEGGRVTFTVQTHLPGWDVVLEPPELSLNPGEPGMVILQTTPQDADAGLGSYQPIVDVEGFVNGESIGGFRKFDWPPVVLHHPRDPFFAEPEISVRPYPPRAGEPTQICAEIRNLSGMTRTVEVQFKWANFGIGLPFQPINGPIMKDIPPYSTEKVCINWIPPFGGHFCVQVEMHILDPQIHYHPQFSQLNLDVAEPLRRGIPHSITFPVGNFPNPFTNPDPTTRTLYISTTVHLAGWQAHVDPDVLPDMAPGEMRPVTLTVIPPDVPLPPDGTPIVDVWVYYEFEREMHIIGGFRKIFRPPVPIHQPDEPPYGESEISIDPYPPRAGEPTKICTKVRNYTNMTQTIHVEFSVANFGIGIPFTPIGPPIMVELPPYGEKEVCVTHIFSYGGHFCVQVMLHMDDYPPVRSQRNLDVAEILVPGRTDCFTVPVGNPFPHPVTITLGLINHTGWEVSFDPQVIYNAQPTPPAPPTLVRICITPTESVLDMEDSMPVIDLEAYVGNELIGGIRKIFRPPVPIHRPRDPIYAEREITVHPYPTRAHEPTELGVDLYNPTNMTQTIRVEFSVANFGIGLPFHPVNGPLTVTIPAHGTARRTIMWIPPHGGLWCIQVMLESPFLNRPFFSRRNIDVGEPLRPGQPHSRPFVVGNPTPDNVTITLGLIPHLPGWGLELSQDVLTNMQPDATKVVTLTVTPPGDRPLPPDGTPIVDVEAYADGMLIGGFRKIHRPPVPVHRPKDPVYAESEIGVDPYPAIAGNPTKLSVEVYNPTASDHVVKATFSVADFGIGLPFTTTGIAPNPINIFVPAGGAAKGHVIWIPPHHGLYCVMVTLEMEGHEPVWSRRNIDVGEPLRRGQPHTLTFLLSSWPYEEPVTITLGLINHLPGWETSLSADSFFDVFYEVDAPIEVTLTVTPPLNAELGTGRPIVDVEAYVNGELLGGFRKLDRPPIPIHKPHERPYAETELSIIPDPPQVGQPAQVCSEVHNGSSIPATVTLEFGWAKFGMGIPFTTTNMSPSIQDLWVGANMTNTACVTWTPIYSGPHCVQVRLIDPSGEYEHRFSQRNVQVIDDQPCGETKVFTFTVYNSSPFTATVEIGIASFNVPANWVITTQPSQTLTLCPFCEDEVIVTVHIPCPLLSQAMRTQHWVQAIQQEAGSVPTIDVEAYVNGELKGGIELQFPGPEFHKVYLPVVLRN